MPTDKTQTPIPVELPSIGASATLKRIKQGAIAHRLDVRVRIVTSFRPPGRPGDRFEVRNPRGPERLRGRLPSQEARIEAGISGHHELRLFTRKAQRIEVSDARVPPIPTSFLHRIRQPGGLLPRGLAAIRLLSTSFTV